MIFRDNNDNLKSAVGILDTFPDTCWESFGSELILEASAHFIGRFSVAIRQIRSSLPYPNLWLSIIEKCLRRQEQVLLQKGTAAFAHLTRTYDIIKTVRDRYPFCTMVNYIICSKYL
jgi:hypothetical protein